MMNARCVALATLLVAACSKDPAPHAPIYTAGMSVSELSDGLAKQIFTADQVIVEALYQAESVENLNAFIFIDSDRALALAGDADKAIQAGTAGPLTGIPIAVKDNTHVAGVPNTAGTPGLRSFVPDESNSVVAALEDAGAIVLGKTNLHELAFGITSNNSTFGAVGNPVDPRTFAGGSSGGTAAAIAAGIVPAGLGTDTGGSVRIPAALTGIVGFRPSSDRYGGDGVTPISSTRDTVGIMAGNVSDVVLLDTVITGDASATADIATLRIGVPRGYFYDNLDTSLAARVEAALKRLTESGVTLVEADVPGIQDLLAQTTFPIALYEVVRDLPAYLEEYETGVTFDDLAAQTASPDVQGLFTMLTGETPPIDDAGYAAAMAARDQMRDVMAAYFRDNNLDAMIFPTTILPARPITGSDETVELNGEQVPTFPTYIRNTEQATIIGMPSISLPAGNTSDGLPVGLCLEAAPGADAALLAIAVQLEPILTE